MGMSFEELSTYGRLRKIAMVYLREGEGYDPGSSSAWRVGLAAAFVVTTTTTTTTTIIIIIIIIIIYTIYSWQQYQHNCTSIIFLISPFCPSLPLASAALKCGPYSMFCKLADQWRDKLPISVVCVLLIFSCGRRLGFEERFL